MKTTIRFARLTRALEGDAMALVTALQLGEL